MEAKMGSKVKVHYRGTFGDGEEFDSSDGGPPLEFQIGESQVIEGFEKNVVGLAAGDSKTFTLPPGEAYGERDDSLVLSAPKGAFPAEGLEPGAGVRVKLPDGQELEGSVTEITDELVTVDFNHPLAGRSLTFEVTVLEVR
ncbi:MAG: peptidylprolyl isomerase [Euryarchaeota archaeon]|nr:peptidylprolyl isomerase [Euryarchaeota archaeon]